MFTGKLCDIYIIQQEQKGGLFHTCSDVQSKNRLLLNIILTMVAAWRLPAELLVIPAVMYWLAALMNIITTDGLFSPVRTIKMHLLSLR